MKREQEIALRAAKVAAAAATAEGGSEYGDSDYGGTSPRSPAGMTSRSPLSPSKMKINFSFKII